MAQKPESRYILRVARHLESCVAREKTNNPYRAGIPDVYYEGNKANLWVEFKWYPRRPEVIDLRDQKKKPHQTTLQQNWLKRSAGNGQLVAVISGTPDGGIILPGLAWDCLIQVKPEHLLSPKEVAAWIYRHTMWVS